jgi:23S rRNA pseudoU1915 N3-methylase RlmH
LKKEKKQILKNIDSKDYVITLEIEGNIISSTTLSKKIEDILIHNSNITFVMVDHTD